VFENLQAFRLGESDFLDLPSNFSTTYYSSIQASARHVRKEEAVSKQSRQRRDDPRKRSDGTIKGLTAVELQAICLRLVHFNRQENEENAELADFDAQIDSVEQGSTIDWTLLGKSCLAAIKSRQLGDMNWGLEDKPELTVLHMLWVFPDCTLSLSYVRHDVRERGEVQWFSSDEKPLSGLALHLLTGE
jgi:hypothetical protein